MDHDRIFKELLTVFFVEFVQLFLPDVAAYLDPTSIEFLDKEVFSDVTAGEKKEVDLLVKARFQEEEAFFLIHVENQAKRQMDFPKRMFTYFARLHEKYSLPVYPVVIFSHNASRSLEPHQYQVAFPGKTVLQFEYVSIQLNRLSWRDYVATPNPVASALMAKMKIAPQDRPKVRLECLRLLATLKLDPARSQLIGGFIATYLQLNAAERAQYEQVFAQLTPEEKETTMELLNPWVKQGWEEGNRAGRQEGIQTGIQEGRQVGIQEGRQEGRQEGIQEGIQAGKEKLVVRQLNRLLGSLSSTALERLNLLSAEQLDELGEDLMDFKTSADLEIWLSRHNTP